MVLGTTYIYVSDIKKSIDFYSKLLQEPPLKENDDRWVQFSNKIALYNRAYDAKIIDTNASDRFNQAYIEDFNKDTGIPKNNLVVFNFEVDDLKSEYQRLKSLNIGKVSALMYVNVHMPYWYFNILDPDGNTLEITGNYQSFKWYIYYEVKNAVSLWLFLYWLSISANVDDPKYHMEQTSTQRLWSICKKRK